VEARSKIVGLHSTEEEDEPAARLGLATGSTLWKLERVRMGGDDCYAFETTYLPAREFPGLGHQLRIHGSLFETLRADYGVVPAFADEEVDATSATGRVAELLKVKRGSPALRIRQVLFSANGHRVLYDVGIYLADRHSLRTRRFR
jgi:GntR family transcriptional regulator